MIEIPDDVTALIFDCDGTLADTMPVHYQSWVEILIPYGLVLSEQRFYDLGGWPTKKIVELLAKEESLELDADQVAWEKEQGFLKNIHLVEPIHPVADTVKKYHQVLPMAVATGAVKSVGKQILQLIGVYDYFQTVVYAEDTKKHKPEPDVFLEAARRIDADPQTSLVFEDTDPGVEAAKRAGMRVIDVRSFHTPRRIT